MQILDLLLLCKYASYIENKVKYFYFSARFLIVLARDSYLRNVCCVASQNLQGLTGTALVAGSPIRHDSTVQGNPVEVQTYQPPWKSLSDFALQSDLEQPAFQQLVGHCSLTAFSLHSVRKAPVTKTGTLLLFVSLVMQSETEQSNVLFS